jgi:hypothetical protein
LFRTLPLGVSLKLLLHQGVAVLGAAGAAAPPQAAVLSVSEALQRQGTPALADAALRRRLLGDAQPLGELSEAQVALYAKAASAYDEGAYADAARAAEAAFAAFSAAPPSASCEALARQAQLLWGASLVRSQGVAAARPHFRWALERDPVLIADRDRFPPPVQRVVEQERAAVSAAAAGKLAVADTHGTPSELSVDGLPRGALPRELALPPHPAKLWVEGGHAHGWAHMAALTADHKTTVKVDALLEEALSARGDEALLDLPDGPEERAKTAGALASAAGVSDLVIVEKAAPPTNPPKLSAARLDAKGAVLAQTTFPLEGADYAAVARALMALSSDAAPPVGATRTEEKGGFPVVPVVLGVAGAVVLAGGRTGALGTSGNQGT